MTNLSEEKRVGALRLAHDIVQRELDRIEGGIPSEAGEWSFLCETQQELQDAIAEEPTGTIGPS